MLNKATGDVLQSDRRNALTRLLLGWTALIIFPSIYAIARYLVPPLKMVGAVTSTIAGRLSEIPRNSSKIVKLGNKPVIVVHTEGGEYKAFSATCTHLGCIIEFRGDKGGYFHCNCHGGEYDLTGKNVSGPPPKPLTPYSLSIREENIIVSSS